jgi:hypothetical protein
VFEAKTVFVLGAGASAEVGLPVGNALLNEICKLIDIKFDFGSQKSGDHLITSALKLILKEGREVSKINEHIHAAWQIIRSAQQGISIDHIVDALEDTRVELVAKLGIVRAIQLAESSSEYFMRPSDHRHELNLLKFKNTWYDDLTKAICEKRKKSELQSVFENISIVSFNYDRCMERYLPVSIGNYYGIPTPEIQQLMPSLEIVRPYGIAGRLEWMSPTKERHGCEMGLEVARLANASEMIRTFTQGVADEAISQRVQTCISEAERVIFLGFAFHPQNMSILEAKVDQNTEILATAYLASDNDRRVIQDSILKTFGYRGDKPSSIIIAAETCSSLFRSYWRTITAPPVPRSIRFQLKQESHGQKA